MNMRASSLLMLIVAASTVTAACISPLITSKSTSTCSSCHASMFFQFLDILEGDAGESIPAFIDGADVLNVTVVFANLCNAGAEGDEHMMHDVSATLASQNRSFRVVDPACWIGDLEPGKSSATWRIYAARAGQDTLVINAQGLNRHSGMQYTDEYLPSPTIQVNYTLPNRAPSISLGGQAGAVLGGGSTCRVCWTSEDEEREFCRVSLSYSTDGFETFHKVADQLPNTGIYDWVLPLMDSPSVRLRADINDSDGAANSSLGPAFAVDSSPPAIVSATPADGEANVTVAAPISIGFSEPVARGLAENLFTIAPPVLDIGWNWSPDGKLMTASHYSFEPNTTYACTMGPGLSDLAAPANPNSSHIFWNFTVPPPFHPAPVITLLSPLGGERYYRHDGIQVIWNASGGAAPLRANISFSDDGGAQFRTVAGGVWAPNAFSFAAPGAISDECVVKVTVYDAFGLEASASGPGRFSIARAPAVVAGFGDAMTHYVNDTVDISWNASGGHGNTTVFVSFQSAGGAVVIASGQPHSGSLGWKVPQMNITSGIFAVNATDGWGTVVECVSRNVTLGPAALLQPGQDLPPVASFAVEQMRLIERRPTTFNANLSYDPDGDALNLTWDFGDGTDPVTTSERSIVHVYLGSGKYNVVLRVTDGQSTVEKTMLVTVEMTPPAIDARRGEWLPTALLLMAIAVGMVGAVYVVFAAKAPRSERPAPPGRTIRKRGRDS
jgi:hypothetical protein